MKIIRDSRKYARTHIAGLLKCNADPDTAYFQIKNIHEICEEGLSSLIDQKLEPGTKLTLSALIFPKKNPIDFHAVVVNCPQESKKPPLYRLCLHFLDMSEENRGTLHEILGRLLKNKKNQKPFPFAVRFHD